MKEVGVENKKCCHVNIGVVYWQIKELKLKRELKIIIEWWLIYGVIYIRIKKKYDVTGNIEITNKTENWLKWKINKMVQ